MFRSHIDIEPMTQLRYFDAITELVAEQPFGSELVLFPQHGLLRSNAASLIEEALATGKASYIGGVDPYTLDQDYKTSLRTTFELAQKGMSVLTSIFMIGKSWQSDRQRNDSFDEGIQYARKSSD